MTHPEQDEPTLDVAHGNKALSRYLNQSLKVLRDRSNNDDFRRVVDDVLNGRASLREVYSTPAFAAGIESGVRKFAERVRAPSDYHSVGLRCSLGDARAGVKSGVVARRRRVTLVFEAVSWPDAESVISRALHCCFEHASPSLLPSLCRARGQPPWSNLRGRCVMVDGPAIHHSAGRNRRGVTVR